MHSCRSPTCNRDFLLYQVLSLSLSHILLKPGDTLVETTVTLDVNSFEDLRSILHDKTSDTVRSLHSRAALNLPPR